MVLGQSNNVLLTKAVRPDAQVRQSAERLLTVGSIADEPDRLNANTRFLVALLYTVKEELDRTLTAGMQIVTDDNDVVPASFLLAKIEATGDNSTRLFANGLDLGARFVYFDVSTSALDVLDEHVPLIGLV